jgi:hypothetical protein
MNSLNFTSKEQAFDFLDDYASQRKEEIERRKLGKDQGLIKSYVLETLPSNGISDMNVPNVLHGVEWQISPVDGADLYRVADAEGHLGFLEPVSSRHLVLHTTKETRRADKTLRNTVFATAQLDFGWLAGSTFETIWQQLVLPQMPDRFVTFKFEHLARFEEPEWDEEDEELDEDWSDDDLIERRASALQITERSEQIDRFLPQLQIYHPPFRAIKMLRIPASGVRGGYDVWSWGKVTYRSPTFRDGRSQVLSLTRLYEEATRVIEQRLWFQTEPTTFGDGGEAVTVTGAPVTIAFDPPLSLSTFQNFVETTFERGQGPFRLWGNPIRVSERKAHIYGIDLHLWKRIYLEITPRQLVAVLPRGTCGNTVHRLVANVQRYLAPNVRAFIGDVSYSDLLRDVFLGRLKA